ncbi:MAG: HD domain-containing protein [Desulfobulbaceae bacterium]|jgi:putative nucleotidyltransferase with HDIG domain|nr:HD domain-containing protein [Desulfobulbaceae bacterium]
MNIPSVSECFSYMNDFGMYAHIREHSLMVARVAEFMYRELAAKGANLPPKELVVAGALLHDIAKSKCLQEGCQHAQTGEEICRDLGYLEVAEMVRYHVNLPGLRPDAYRRNDFSGPELVYYSDKRVKHDSIVMLDERLAYILGKYAKDKPEWEGNIHANFRMCGELEGYLFTRLDFTPADVAARIDRNLFT